MVGPGAGHGRQGAEPAGAVELRVVPDAGRVGVGSRGLAVGLLHGAGAGIDGIRHGRDVAAGDEDPAVVQGDGGLAGEGLEGVGRGRPGIVGRTRVPVAQVEGVRRGVEHVGAAQALVGGDDVPVVDAGGVVVADDEDLAIAQPHRRP